MKISLASSVLVCACAARAAEAPARVSLGVDELLARQVELIAGKRVGLITNPSGVDGELVPTADRLARDGRFRLVQLYGPEHGIRGDAAAGDLVGDAVDPVTGIAVESLYGARHAPSAETLAKLDVVLFDIQDVGSRTYTYISTLGETMKACAAAHKPLIVLDRPNPLGGDEFEGPIIEERWRSFIGWSAIPVTHGMTVGEIARFYDATCAPGCDLTIVPMSGWRRDMTWGDTGLTWTQTSPHIPHELQAQLYVAAGMVAAVTNNVSDGIGSTTPFELIGAEFVDANALADALARLALPGVRFQALAYKPFYGKFKDKPLRGVRMVLDDSHPFRPLHTALAVLVTLHAIYPEQLQFADETTFAKHWGNTRVLEAIRAGQTVDQIEASWETELAAFAALRQSALIY
jgi:uncharacterized protein YbbC (DUF1343 family)